MQFYCCIILVSIIIAGLLPRFTVKPAYRGVLLGLRTDSISKPCQLNTTQHVVRNTASNCDAGWTASRARREGGQDEDLNRFPSVSLVSRNPTNVLPIIFTLRPSYACGANNPPLPLPHLQVHPSRKSRTATTIGYQATRSPLRERSYCRIDGGTHNGYTQQSRSTAHRAGTLQQIADRLVSGGPYASIIPEISQVNRVICQRATNTYLLLRTEDPNCVQVCWSQMAQPIMVSPFSIFDICQTCPPYILKSARDVHVPNKRETTLVKSIRHPSSEIRLSFLATTPLDND